MVTIDQIDFSKLKPYDGKVTKCFEQLCYQIAQKEYKHLGIFTPIDGSGGDGGVEFYLKLTNGQKWGWQCKFFGDNGRLNVSSRDSAIEDSLEAACRNHADLTKWFLCLKTDLTTNSLSSKGKFSKGERNWFENELSKKIPIGRTVDLEHWGESSFITFLREAKHIGIRSFFFGDLEFDESWFKNKFQENFEKVKDKYDPELHTIDKYTQSKIDFILFDSNYCNQLNTLKKELLQKSNEIQTAIKEFRDEKMLSAKEEAQRESYIISCDAFKKHIAFVFDKIEFVENCFKNYSEELLVSFNLKELNESFYNYIDKINFSVFEEKSRALKDASEISYLISEFSEIYNDFFRNYFHESQNEIHFIADAAKGKTHLSSDIAYKRVISGKPAIFITADKFTDETSITDTIKKSFDIDTTYSLDEILQAIDLYASIIKQKIPLIIDGLNETTYNRLFTPLWKNHLSSFSTKISKSKNIIFITTCRRSYINRIWDNIDRKKFHYLNGFEDYETILEAVNKYFNKYKLKADLFFASLDKFRDPIFLKIFCEIKNSNKKSDNEVEVNIEEESTFDIINEYLKQVNKKVSTNNHLLRENEPFIRKSLETLAKHLWDNNLREVDVDTFYKLIDGDKPYQKDNMKAEILMNEGLVIARDTRDENEFVSFTYQIISGYKIAEYLINNNNPNYFISNEFINKLYLEDIQHPLFDDVIDALCLLLPQLKDITLHNLLEPKKSKIKIEDNESNEVEFIKNLFSVSVTSLFSLPSKFVKEIDTKLITSLFKKSKENKKSFFSLSFRTLSDTTHPLNALFLSQLLNSLDMNERDISWTEYIREKSADIENFIKEFESQCKNVEEESVVITQKQHLISKIIMWFLTSTDRALRDSATRALYYYGRKFPFDFSLLVYEALKINDPYVWERALASLYGVTMAEHNSYKNGKFGNEILPEISKNIYNLIFKENAPFSTTHILARDCARRTIEISLIHHPNILTPEEIKNIRPLYFFGGIRNWGEFNYGNTEYSYSGPIYMDFSNYTIGHIVKDGHSYANPAEKIKVRKQIYWRIYNLGWNEELFREAEKALGNDSYYDRGRTEKAKIDRYGKKYSWIAYFENAGLRNDLGLLDEDWDRFRISDADIDPSFPEKPENKRFINQDLLGDRAEPLLEWYEKGGMPFIEDYLSISNLNGLQGQWICLNGVSIQEDVPAERRRFSFIRSLLIKETDYDDAIELLKKQRLGGRWLPEIHENYYTFAGEMFYCNEATQKNYTALEFETAKKKIRIKIGDPRYYPSFFLEEEDDVLNLKEEFPDEIEREISEIKEFEILLPVMEYNWESHHSYLNEAGHTTVVAKEIVNHLGLIDQSQTFDLYETNGDKASVNIYYHADYNNNHSLVYLRKDLLNKFLSENKLKFVWAVWGERETSFQTNERRDEFFTTHPFREHQVFQKVVEYQE